MFPGCIALASGDDPSGFSGSGGDTESGKSFQGHFYIGGALEGRCETDLVSLEKWERKEKARYELGTDIPGKLKSPG